MKVLVTGSSGFFGSNFLEFLKKKNVPYAIYDRSNPEKITLDFDAVVNFSGLTPYSNIKNVIASPESYSSANVDGTGTLIRNVIRNKNLKRFINIGTAAEYGCGEEPITEDSEERPEGPYGESKLEQSRLIKEFFKEKEVKVLNLRVFNVAGLPNRAKNGQGLAKNPLLFENLTHQFGSNFNGKITVGNEDDVRDYVDIEDIMTAVFLALETEKGGQYEVVNICSGKGTKLKDVVNLFGRVVGKECEILSSGNREATQSIGVNDKAKKILNWAPQISLEESIKKMIW